MSFNAIRENKILMKISESTVPQSRAKCWLSIYEESKLAHIMTATQTVDNYF